MEALVRSTLFVSSENRINLGENGSMSLLYYRAESFLVKKSFSLLYPFYFPALYDSAL